MKYIIWIVVLGVMVWLGYQYMGNQDGAIQAGEQEVSVFFNENTPTEVLQVAVKRGVFASDDEAVVALSTVRELLKGPTADEEEDRGLLTAIPEGTEAHSVVIQDGVATVDFNETFDLGVGGATLVTAIRQQVEKTLRQFSLISFVKMTIDGDRDAVLEP